MPGKGVPFHKGNKVGVGNQNARRPGLNIVALADAAAEELLKQDKATVARKKGDGKGRMPTKLDIHRARERISRMCKGRVPTRIAIAGDTDGPPVPFQYVEVGKSGPQPTPEVPTPEVPESVEPVSPPKVSKKKKKAKR